MNSSLLRRPVCINCRIAASSLIPQQKFRSISARSAINKGLRTTRYEEGTERGGRSRPSRFGGRPQIDTTPRKRASLSERIDKANREEDRKSQRQREGATDSPFSRRERLSGDDRRRPRLSTRDDFQYVPRQQTLNSTYRQAYRESSSASSKEPSKSGLLREIKTAAKLIETLREGQASGDDISNLKSDLRRSLANVNSFTAAGHFRDSPADAVADLMRKKAADGTFIRGKPRDDDATVIVQKQDGTLDLFIGRAAPHRSFKQTRVTTARPKESPSPRQGMSDRRQSSPEDREDEGIPVSIPYTTAASQFLYGYNSVMAALRAQRRRLYKLYVHPKIFKNDTGRNTEHGDSRGMAAGEFVSLAKAANVPFVNEFRTRLLDTMSEGRPHNGLILEVSKLPAPPVISLGKPSLKQGSIPLVLGKQTAEEAAVNGSPSSIPAVCRSWRYPLIVFLDGITDPGNIGNIIRTCHFYGVDAVAIAVNTCANLSSGVLAKASSGACEAVRLLSVSQPSNFIFESAKYRWKVYAAMAPDARSTSRTPNLTTSALAADSPLAKHPCILMLGAEGEGLRENLKNRADYFVSIGRGERAEEAVDVGVDSMNVSVAAGVLLESFLRKPDAAPTVIDSMSELGF